MQNAGTILPGDTGAAGSIAFTGNYTQTAGGALAIELGGAVGGAGTDYDRIAVTGAGNVVTLAGVLSVDALPTLAAPVGTVFTIIDNQTSASVLGTFAGLSQNAIISVGGWQFRVSYIGQQSGDPYANDVTLTVVNHVPDAVNDAKTMLRNSTLNNLAVRVNDTDIDGDALTVTGVTQGSHGSVSYTPTGVNYTPASGYTGTDTFTYTISDGHGGTDTATVTITVVAPATVSGTIWGDTNHNGIQDAGEWPVWGGVTISIFDANNNLVASQMVMGSYYFMEIMPGDGYRIQVTLPTGVTVSPQNQGTDDAVDNDFDSTGSSGPINLTAGMSLDLDIGWY